MLRINISASSGQGFLADFQLCSPTQTYKYSKTNVNTGQTNQNLSSQNSCFLTPEKSDQRQCYNKNTLIVYKTFSYK